MKIIFELKIFALICFTLTTSGLLAQERTASKNLSAKELDAMIQKSIDESGMVGLSAAIIVKGKIVWMKGFGYADKELRKPFTPNTIMNIASITKTITGVCVMKAVEEGKLSLDADINTYLPFKVINPHFPDEKITLRNLGTHTSGIMDRSPVYENSYFYGGDSPVALEDFLRSYFDVNGELYSKDNFLNYKPGTFWEYSNIATGLAGYIVERVTGIGLNVYSRNNIFKPLGMKNTGWFSTEINMGAYSKGYDKQGDTLKLIPYFGVPTYPDGGVRTSVAELSKYFITLLGDGQYHGKRILKRSSIDSMQRYQFSSGHKPENLNLSSKNAGLFWATKDGGRKIGYGGTDPGVKTEMLADLDKEVAVVLFSNTSLNNRDFIKYYVGVFNELFQYGRQLKKFAIQKGED
ncbi:hypothetical protein ASU31_00860 [Pedobacter ginsenosidimutans]|uniref:Beta-lactamase-related domain-containing protein n=1 Tax=Pedobacter ginsenosidimutans TaxID=687842 RepID=A0A0T5VWC6_9SPHI|nr:serine hydrolase domain-containing protein [Pedobacter ginsenosidimutans]KRT17876.1 hypothetical protein ASU31_00860 [Pedobacter ginsenosidimutans]